MTIAQRSNPLTSITNKIPKSTIMQHGFYGIHSPIASKLSHRHTRSLPVDSIKLIVAVIHAGNNYEETLTYILRVWAWVTRYNPDCEFLIQANVTHTGDQELQCLRSQSVNCFGKSHFYPILYEPRTTLIRLGQLNGGPISIYQWHGTPPSANSG